MNVYVPSPIKRKRATKQEVTNRRVALWNIVDAHRPMTVRQVYYQATVLELVDKTEAGYRQVQNDLKWLRKRGFVPYEAIADSTRWMRKPRSFSNPQDAIEETAAFYRKALWADQDSYVEIWLEKDALAGVLHPITAEFDVPLMVSRGYASLSFLHSAAEHIKRIGKPTFIYHLGDNDPSGVNAAHTIDISLREFAPNAHITFERLAVLPEQIEAWSLPTRPTKKSDSRAKGFGDRSVELDAIEPDMLRSIVRGAIERHLPAHEFEVLKVAEESERKLLWTFAEGFEADG